MDNLVYEFLEDRTVLNLKNPEGKRAEIFTKKINGERVYFLPFHREPIKDWRTARSMAIKLFEQAGYK